MRMTRIHLALITALCATSAFAQEPLTLERAIAASTSTYPSVSAAAAEARVLGAQTEEAEAQRWPSATLSSSAMQYEEPMVATPIHGFNPQALPPFDRTLVQSSLGASWTAFDAGARSSRITQLSSLTSAAEASVEVTRQAVAARTAAAYLTVLTRAATLHAHELRLGALNAELDRVAQLEKVGRAAQVDRLRVEAVLAGAEAEGVEISTALDTAERSLARLTTLPVEQTRAANLVHVSAPSSTLDRAGIDAAALESSPLLRASQSRLQAARAAAGIARAGRWPQVQLGGALLSFADSGGFLTEEWNAGAQLRMSLFDAGATRARIAQARAAERTAEEQYRLALTELRESVDRALAEVQNARAIVESLNKAVERYQEVARIDKLRLDNGAGTQSDYLRSEADLMVARANLAAASNREVLATVELARAAGLLDAPFLQQNFGSNR